MGAPSGDCIDSSGAPLSALFQDTFYGNNVGDLKLEILALR